MKAMKIIQRNLFMLFSVGASLCIFVLISMIAGDVYAAKINQSTNTRSVSGLVGMWSFDDSDVAGTNAYDRSTSFATGTISGTVTRVEGKIGQALSVDGSSKYITISHQASINFASTDNFTIGFWAKFNPQTASSPEIFEKWSEVGAYPYKVGIASGGKVFACLYDTVNNPCVTALTSTSDNRWHNVILVHSASLKKLFIYIDGTEDNTATYATLNTITNTSNVCIGRRCNGNVATLFNGSIDDLRMYNRAFSAAEAKQLSNLGASKVNATTNARSKNGLVGMWSFNAQDISGTDVYDRSTSFATGTLSGSTVPAKIAGKIGQGLSFDGSTSYVNLGNVTKLKVSSVSVAAWVRMPSTMTTGYIYRFRSGIEFYSLASGKFGWSVYNGTTSGAASSTLATYNDNRWHHVVGMYDGTSVKLYVDGVLSDSKSFSGNISYGSGAAIGRDGDNSALYFKGSLDEVRVYNYALTAAEIKQLYNLGVSKINASTNDRAKNNLVGLWSFDGADMAGTDAYDKSGSFATGTLSGATLPTKVAGKTGQALNFDGSTSYITVSDQSTLKPSTAMTLSTWVRPRTIATGSGNVNSIIEKGNINTAGYGIFSANGNQFCGFVKLSGGLYGGASTRTFNTGKWHHVAIVVDTTASSILKLYVNGVQETLADIASTCGLSVVASGSIATDTSALTFGARTGSTAFYDGRIDDVRLYNYALSAAEVNRLYNLGK